MALLHGRCHCGSLQWTVTGDSVSLPVHILCHCYSCKLLGGGDFCGILLTSIAALRFEKGTPKFYTYLNPNGDKVHCAYCSNCTTHAYHRDESRGDEIQIRTFPLLEAKFMIVDKEINVGEQFAWVKKVDGAKIFKSSIPAVPRGRHGRRESKSHHHHHGIHRSHHGANVY
ncbi:Mss4-like protein [Lipomyces japonicus]|uniref:Mss4-like protein n=1 Tax=Lipomyces japonicus TaxID=56871 RepID=UPI0034CD54A9